MEVTELAEVLAPLHLQAPDLEMLRPTEASYTSLLLQPAGPIFASAARIGGLDQDLNGRKVLAFARLAIERGAHLAVTPEYFTPWHSLRNLIERGLTPAPGALWVLGAESIRAEELEQFKADLAEHVDVIFEPVGLLAADRALLDPVVLLFATTRLDGTPRLVAVVQFKTYPSRDKLFVEEGLLKRGTKVYRLRGRCGTLSALTFICSDAFALDDKRVHDIVDRSTLIHIQLNPDPRNLVYRQYRKTTFDLDARMSECHIVCLNWARTVVQHDEVGDTEIWPAVGCSAWYCADNACAYSDDVVLPNHRLGFYYARMAERRHALFLDYDEAIFECRVPKVVMRGPAVLANRNGPNSLARYEWNADSWQNQIEARTAGFDVLLNANAQALAALEKMPVDDALAIERLLALSAGTVIPTEDWHSLKNIDSFLVGPDEIVRRITFAQDANETAAAFRYARLEVVANIRHELNSREMWPPQISGTDKDAHLMLGGGRTPFNFRCTDGKPGLICYLGDSPSPQMLENIPSKLIDLLRRTGGDHQTRLCVVYRRFGELKFAPLPGMTRFDDALQDERDILSVEPQE